MRSLRLMACNCFGGITRKSNPTSEGSSVTLLSKLVATMKHIWIFFG